MYEKSSPLARYHIVRIICSMLISHSWCALYHARATMMLGEMINLIQKRGLSRHHRASESARCLTAVQIASGLYPTFFFVYTMFAIFHLIVINKNNIVETRMLIRTVFKTYVSTFSKHIRGRSGVRVSWLAIQIKMFVRTWWCHREWFQFVYSLWDNRQRWTRAVAVNL